MKSLIRWCLSAALLLSLQPVRAQQPAPEKPKAKPSVPAKVQVVFLEMEGDKKISSLPYSFNILVEDKDRPGGRYSVNLRDGVKVPVEVDSKDQKISYIDVGTSIDCGVHAEEDGKFRVFLNFDRSALYPNKSAEGERMVTDPNGAPLIRQFRFSEDVVVKDGQTAEMILSTDPLSGHTQKVSVTLNLAK
jgi:hypothetical protein